MIKIVQSSEAFEYQNGKRQYLTHYYVRRKKMRKNRVEIEASFWKSRIRQICETSMLIRWWLFRIRQKADMICVMSEQNGCCGSAARAILRMRPDYSCSCLTISVIMRIIKRADKGEQFSKIFCPGLPDGKFVTIHSHPAHMRTRRLCVAPVPLLAELRLLMWAGWLWIVTKRPPDYNFGIRNCVREKSAGRDWCGDGGP